MHEISQYHSFSIKDGEQSKEKTPLLMEKVFDKHKTMRRFFECVENGSERNTNCYRKRWDQVFFKKINNCFWVFFRYILAFDDPDHIVNKMNIHGETPLYVAARNANLRVS